MASFLQAFKGGHNNPDKYYELRMENQGCRNHCGEVIPPTIFTVPDEEMVSRVMDWMWKRNFERPSHDEIVDNSVAIMIEVKDVTLKYQAINSKEYLAKRY